MQQFHMCLDDICFNLGAANPLLGSTVLYSSKTIEEKPTIAFVTDLLVREQLSAVVSIHILLTITIEISLRRVD